MNVDFPTVKVDMTSNEAYRIGCHLIYSITRDYDLKNIKVTSNYTEDKWRKNNSDIINLALNLMTPVNKSYGESMIEQFCKEAWGK